MCLSWSAIGCVSLLVHASIWTVLVVVMGEEEGGEGGTQHGDVMFSFHWWFQDLQLGVYSDVKSGCGNW